MQINKFFIIVALHGFLLSPLSYAQSTTQSATMTPKSNTYSSDSIEEEGAQSSRGVGLPTKEVTIDPANAKSEVAYPPITKDNENLDTNLNSQNNSNTGVIDSREKNHKHIQEEQQDGD